MWLRFAPVRPRTLGGLALVALLLTSAGSATPEAGADHAPFVPVILPGGLFLGFTHGGDPVPDEHEALPPDAPERGADAAAGLGGPFPRAPHCIAADTPAQVEPRARLIYARAHDDDDLYALKAPVVRNLAFAANGYVHDAGVATGTAANLKVECEGGVSLVVEAILPTDRAAASPSTIMSDLRALGHSDPGIKHWVYYDDRSACACGGIANLMPDSTPTALNLNNGWAFSMYAITFGYDSTRIMLHELGHTLGAVQTSAPHSTGAGHCTDGRDIMCYNDGGPRAGGYTTDVCPVQVWDCGHDDYFHTNPAPGDYLFDHWNLGSRANRFIVFADTLDAPVMDVPAPVPFP